MTMKNVSFGLLVVLCGCSFNVEVTSQRTALENQVMGVYKELEDDLVLISSVRQGAEGAAASQISPEKKAALEAKLNQDFNKDDIVELKDLEILGETEDGVIVILPKGTGKVGSSPPKSVKLAEMLVKEENRDRAEIWKRIIASNANLSNKDLANVRRTYAKTQRDAASVGHWLQDEDGKWRQKKAM